MHPTKVGCIFVEAVGKVESKNPQGLWLAPTEGNGIDRIRRDISPEVSALLLMLCKPRDIRAA